MNDLSTLLARKLEVVLQLQPELQPAPLPLPPEEIPETEEGPGDFLDNSSRQITAYILVVPTDRDQ